MIATYRLQLTPSFGFAEAEAVLPYLKRLGISHLYLSPITEVLPGSTHGYDVENHNAIRKEFGGEEGWERLLCSLCEIGLEAILDFVPNHAGVGPHNEAWQSVLAYGQHSPFSRYFDIDWHPLEESLHAKVLLPFLGRPYGQAFDEGEIQLRWLEGGFRAAYFDDSFSLSPLSYADILNVAMSQYDRTELFFDLKELHAGYCSLSAEDMPRAEMLSQRLGSFAEHIDWERVLTEFTGQRLHDVLEQQNWRLASGCLCPFKIRLCCRLKMTGILRKVILHRLRSSACSSPSQPQPSVFLLLLRCLRRRSSRSESNAVGK